MSLTILQGFNHHPWSQLKFNSGNNVGALLFSPFWPGDLYVWLVGSVTCNGDWRDYLIYTMYDLIILKSVCTVIQEYCRRKYCVWLVMIWSGRVDHDYAEEIKKWKITSSFVTNWGLVRDINCEHLSQWYRATTSLNTRPYATIVDFVWCFSEDHTSNVWSRGILEETTTGDLRYS